MKRREQIPWSKLVQLAILIAQLLNKHWPF